MTTAANSSHMPPPAITLGLSRITHLLGALSSPHLRIPIVHIAGTNGKGSTCAYLESILRTSGFRVGRFTSPYLVEPRDSITLDDVPLAEEDYIAKVAEVKAAGAKAEIGASPFEELTATAFLAFAEAEGKVDLAVVEVGMGGATDATNVCPSANTLAVAITPIDLDHQAFLGDTVEKIAGVKAGVMKDGVPAVLAQQPHSGVEKVVEAVARSHGSDVFVANGTAPSPNNATESAQIPLGPSRSLGSALQRPVFKGASEVTTTLPLAGDFQLANASTAALLAVTLATHPHPTQLLPALRDRITSETIAEGIASTRWAGRADWVEIPCRAMDLADDGQAVRILVDGAHNPSAAAALGEYLLALPAAPLTIVLAISSPRDPAALLSPLLRHRGASKESVRLVATKFSLPEGMPWVSALAPLEVLGAASALSADGVKVEAVGEAEDVERAVRMAVQGGREGERILVCGSLYLVADVVRWTRSVT